jgi:hypothetical protein
MPIFRAHPVEIRAFGSDRLAVHHELAFLEGLESVNAFDERRFTGP